MKQFLTGIAKVLPTLLEHSTLQVSLQGWPAAAAVAFAGATLVAAIIVLSGSQGATPEA